MWHGHGHAAFRRPVFFERGSLKYLILDLLSQKPRHGYEIIREIEEKSGGYYSPSPGTVYPTLQMLEDLGHVQVKEQDGKKVYELTDEGKTYLKEHKERIEEHRRKIAECCSPSGKERHSMHDVKRLFRHFGLAMWQVRDDLEKTKAIKEILEKARTEIDIIVGEQ